MVKVEVNKKNKRVLIATYGTLRVGHGNYRRLLQGKATFLGTQKTAPNFTMYGKGQGFPIVVDKGNTAIEIDVFAVEDNDVLNDVHRLEGCSGIPGNERNWYDIIPIDTEYGKAYMYVMHREMRAPVVESGNWNKQ